MPVEAGQVIAERYRLVRPIGKGAQAAVWIAEHLALGSQVAVKIMDAELVQQGDARERFRREATAAAQLRSAHVVHILDHGIENGQPFMVMEYLEGEDLFARLEKKGRLSLAEASVVVTQIARALARAHAAGIVHRDLKPENVYLVPNEDEEVAKVLDFGVAKFLEAGASQRRTSAGTLLGTPHYMSPEQVRGVGEIDHRSDLWSLGVIAYQLTVGDLPFESEGVGDLLIKITMEKIPVPSKAHAPLPKSFDEWFAKACHRDPDKRFQTARELAEALARVAGLIPAADSLRGAAPAKGRSEPPAFDVDFDEQPSIPPPPAPPPPDVAQAAAGAPAAPAAAAKPASEDVDDEWPEEPPSPSMPPPPAAATPAPAAAAKGPPPRPLGAKPATPAPSAVKPAAAAATKPASLATPAPPKVAAALKDMPTRGPRLAPPTAADLRVAPPSMPTQPDPEEVRPSAPAEIAPPPPAEPKKADAVPAQKAEVPAPQAAAAKVEPADAVETLEEVEPAESKPAPAAAPPKPAPPAKPAAAPAPRPSASRTSSPPVSSRSSDPPRSKNQLSSTISGASGDVIPPPELDGARKKRAVLWVAVLAVAGAIAIAIAVVNSQGTGTPKPANAGPSAPTAETKAPPPPAPTPAATPSASSEPASSASAVDPGTSKRPIKGGSSAAPVAPRPGGGARKPKETKDGEIVIDVPLPDREVPVPPSP